MKENRILYDTMYRDSGVGRPTTKTSFARDREIIGRILEEWKEKGKVLLHNYDGMKEGMLRPYEAFMIHIRK
jgi:hypothetical protein